MNTCTYCGQSRFTNDRCDGCNAALSVRKMDPLGNPLEGRERQQPFAYNGYIVWPLRDWSRDQVEFHFYRGETLVEVIEFAHEHWRNLLRADLSADPMPFVWKLFELAQGHRHVLVIQEEGRRLPAMFAITRVDHPVASLTWDALVEQYKMQGSGLT